MADPVSVPLKEVMRLENVERNVSDAVDYIDQCLKEDDLCELPWVVEAFYKIREILVKDHKYIK